MTILARARLTTVVPSGPELGVRPTLVSGTQGGPMYLGLVFWVGGNREGQRHVEMGVGCVLESWPQGVWREVQELTLEETDHHTGLGRPGWGHLG